MERGGGKGLIMMSTYTQMDNTLGLNLRYSQILWDFPILPGTEKIIGLTKYGAGIEGGMNIANILGDFSGLCGVFFK